MGHYSPGLIVGIALLVLVAVGTCGYILLEGYGVLDALYMTVISLTTVGYREIRPLSPGGQVFTILLLITGIGLVAYAVRQAAGMLIEGGLREILEHKRMQREIESLTDHVIVCGLSRTGLQVLKDLQRKKKPKRR